MADDFLEEKNTVEEIETRQTERKCSITLYFAAIFSNMFSYIIFKTDMMHIKALAKHGQCNGPISFTRQRQDRVRACVIAS